jgi:hypothetical protein
MNRKIVRWYRRLDDYFLNRRPTMAFLILLIGCSVVAFAEDNSQRKNSPVSFRATHLLGFEGVPSNANGILTIEAEALQFQKSGKPAVQVKIASVQGVFLGDQSRQLGGLPMTLGKAAVPFGGGRAISLFAHEKYDTLTLGYVDANGGLHGAIFQFNKEQGEVVRNELVTSGAHVTSNDGELTKPRAAEGPSENK